jgi:uncharacterized protein (TIGR03435 family)
MPWRVNAGNGLPTFPRPLAEIFQTIKGGSGWVQSDRFTIDAIAEGPQDPEMMRGPMMRVVLEDRFKLKIHREARDFPVYVLTVAKGAAKLEPAKDGRCIPMDPAKGPPTRGLTQHAGPPVLCGGFHASTNGGLDVYDVTLAELCTLISTQMDRDVIDKTGIAGKFDIHLELFFAEMAPSGRASKGGMLGDQAEPAATDPVGSVTTAVRKLGLRLEPAKMIGEFIVIDHVEKPTAN